jgi:hypothetical protein
VEREVEDWVKRRRERLCQATSPPLPGHASG